MRVDPETVPLLLRRAGVVGAGGAGFPTYVKFERPTKVFIANGTESEPGYFADKLLMRDRSDSIAKALRLLRDGLGYEQVVLAIKKKHLGYAAHLIQEAEESGDFEMAYVPDQYMMGEEKTLTKFVTGQAVPKGAIPPHVGVTVDNVETLHNLYWALAEHRPVTSKFLQTLGEVHTPRVVQAPVGTPVDVVLGEDAKRLADHALIDGGPLLGDVVEPDHVIQRTTNGIFLVDRERLKGRGKYYPGPGHEAPDHISVISDEVDTVRVPLASRYGDAAVPVVSVGDGVTIGQEIGAYRPDSLSVSCHASIPGVVTRITDRFIEIQRDDQRTA